MTQDETVKETLELMQTARQDDGRYNISQSMAESVIRFAHTAGVQAGLAASNRVDCGATADEAMAEC